MVRLRARVGVAAQVTTTALMGCSASEVIAVLAQEALAMEIMLASKMGWEAYTRSMPVLWVQVCACPPSGTWL